MPGRHIARRSRHAQPCTCAHSAHASAVRCCPRCRSCSVHDCWQLETMSRDEIATRKAAEPCERTPAPTPDMMSDVWVGLVVGMGWQAHLQYIDHLRSRCCRLHHLKLDHLQAMQLARQSMRALLVSIQGCSSSTTSFRGTGSAVAWKIEFARPLRSPISTDGPCAASSADISARFHKSTHFVRSGFWATYAPS